MDRRPVQDTAAWMKQRAHLMLTKAPREAPVLLIVVLILALVVLALYVFAAKVDTAMVLL